MVCSPGQRQGSRVLLCAAHGLLRTVTDIVTVYFLLFFWYSTSLAACFDVALASVTLQNIKR
jgi:hypothetical protein